MFCLEKVVRPNIISLTKYSSARDEFSGTEGIFLDANENPYGILNRYPDPYQRALKEKLSILKSVSNQAIFIGNGSDEIIDLAFRIFCTPAIDKALLFPPTYGMYKVAADINNVQTISIALNPSFQINTQALEPYLKDITSKLLFICSPNNPTGNHIDKATITYILETFKGIVIIDEAYIDFSPSVSWTHHIEKYPNLIVCQTLSKAWGLAAARIGIAYANTAIIKLFNKVKPPYNISMINQRAALKALNNTAGMNRNMKRIIQEKKWLKEALESLNIIERIYPSDANFWLVEVANATTIYKKLLLQKIIIRNRNNAVKNCVRITVGTPEENRKLIHTLQAL